MSTTPKTPLSPEERKRMNILYAAAAALGLAAVFLVPLLIGVLLAFLGKKYLKRVEALGFSALGLLYLVIYAATWPREYFTWYGALLGIGTGGRASEPPILTLLAISMLGVGVAHVISKNKVLSWGIGGRAGVTTGHEEQILPTPIERVELDRAAVVAPGASLYSASTPNSLASTEPRGKRSFPMGVNKVGAPVLIREDEINKHGLLFGSTGSGKTESIKVLAAGLMDLGWDGLILDLKEDAQTGGLMDWCQEYADYHALGFQKFRLSDPSPSYWFNVLHGMGADEARDTILASQEFEAAYYRALNEKQLGQLVTLLFAATEIDPVRYPAPTVYSIGKILASPDLPAATREMVATVIATIPSLGKDDFDSLLRPEKAMAEAAGGLGARLTAMYETKVGRGVLRPGENRSPFDVTRPGLSYVGLDSMGKPELTRLVSASVLRRMAVYAADRTSGKLNDKSPRFLIVDEANFVNRRLLLELLSRARSAGIACVVCTQGPTDWQAREAGEPDLTSLVQNTNVAIIMGQGERTNAELCADIIGRAEKSVMNQRVADGQLMDAGSLSTKVDYLVSPDALRSLTVGEAVIRVGKPNEWRSWAKILQRDPKLIVGSSGPFPV
jgi:hypothetical protein